MFDLVLTRLAREAIEQSSNAVIVGCEGCSRYGSGGKVTVFPEKENQRRSVRLWCVHDDVLHASVRGVCAEWLCGALDLDSEPVTEPLQGAAAGVVDGEFAVVGVRSGGVERGRFEALADEGCEVFCAL